MQTTEIPLIPLTHLVVFPKVTVPLHVSEPRYPILFQEMMRRHLQPGVVLVRPCFNPPAEELSGLHRTGCLVAIEGFEKLPLGRITVLLRGLQKFHIIDLRHRQPHCSARVRFIQDRDVNFTRAEKHRLFRHLWDITCHYVEEVWKRTPTSVLHDIEPGDLEALINGAAMLLDVDLEQKQRLLELDSLETRFAFVKQIIDERLAGERLIQAADGLDFDAGMN